MSKSYGVWVAIPTSYDAQTPRQDPRTPHITVQLSSGSSNNSNDEATAEINVKSTDKDTRLVYWVNKNFSHPITTTFRNLPLGLKNIQSSSSSDLALDFQRTKPALLDLDAGQVLPSYAKGPNNDILDKLEPILNQAIEEKARLYIFGQSYHDRDGESGIHDVHMNQGNSKKYGNAVYSDGSFFVQFADGHWEAVFLAFASQRLPTNDETGDPDRGAQTFAERLGADGGDDE